jgi:hypothetical protein
MLAAYFAVPMMAILSIFWLKRLIDSGIFFCDSQYNNMEPNQTTYSKLRMPGKYLA